LEVALAAELLPDAKDAERLRGEYNVGVNQMLKSPAGWRSPEGVRCVSLPPGVADRTTQRELALLMKAGTY